MSAEDFRTRPNGAQQVENASRKEYVVSAIFDDSQAAHAAITELRQMAIPAEDISLISRNEQDGSASGSVAVSHETVGEEGLTHRASTELPNDEELPITTAGMTGDDTPVVFDYEVPPDEPLGGSRRLGLKTEDDLVRRDEASTGADVDIYTDFPSSPGGVDPDSPVNATEAATEQIAAELGEERIGSAVIGAGLGGVAGLVVGIAALVVPGIGPILAAGPLAMVIGSMLAGGAVGGIIGALATVGVPEEYARQYAASIQEGSTLVSVRTDALGRDAVERVLVAHGGREVH